MKLVRRCKEPMVRQIKAMSNNLTIVTGDSVNIQIDNWSHRHNDEPISHSLEITIWLTKEAMHYKVKTWPEIFDVYYKLMEKYRK